MSNLVLLTCPSPWILDKTQTGIIPITRFHNIHNKNRHNSRTSDDINMKIGLIYNNDKKNTRSSTTATTKIRL